MRPAYNYLSAGIVATFGSPGFFVPRVPPPFFAAGGGPEAISFYDTTPLKGTLEESVDFDRINHREVRVSLGAVNVRTGASVYFDNERTRIGPEHVTPVSSSPGDEVPHMFTRKSRPRLGRIVIRSVKRLGKSGQRTIDLHQRSRCTVNYEMLKTHLIHRLT
jgi:hypothetical protein